MKITYIFQIGIYIYTSVGLPDYGFSSEYVPLIVSTLPHWFGLVIHTYILGINIWTDRNTVPTISG